MLVTANRADIIADTRVIWFRFGNVSIVADALNNRAACKGYIKREVQAVVIIYHYGLTRVHADIDPGSYTRF